MGRARPVVALPGMVAALVSAGGAMGGGANDGPDGCAGCDADGVRAVVAVMWTLVHRGWWR